jgi:uncharacterized protein (DUF433 family)
MSALPITAIVPLFTDPAGAIRVRGTRVLLDTIVIAFQAGATAEEIAQQYPSVQLADVYLIIAHYLTHKLEIEAYLSQRGAKAEDLQRTVEALCDPVGIRDRLLARQNGRKETKS